MTKKPYSIRVNISCYISSFERLQSHWDYVIVHWTILLSTGRYYCPRDDIIVHGTILLSTGRYYCPRDDIFVRRYYCVRDDNIQRSGPMNNIITQAMNIIVHVTIISFNDTIILSEGQ
jgi:hypothetical protein